jgi:hypothetical protein
MEKKKAEEKVAKKEVLAAKRKAERAAAWEAKRKAKRYTGQGDLF